MKRPVHYALIGATGIGGMHLDALRAMENRGEIKLVAVADPALSHSTKLRTALAGQGIQTYLDYHEMLRRQEDIEVVAISAPIPLHLPMTLACLERDVFVYLEKPPVPVIQHLRTLIAADRNQRVGVGFQMICTSWVREAKRAIMEGRLGRLRSIRISACWPRLDNYYGRNASAGRLAVNGEPVFDGPATNALAHLIHNAMYFAGPHQDGFDIPTEVQAELYRARPIESYDVACLRAKLSSGVIVTAALTHATEKLQPYRMEIRGSDGWMRITENDTAWATSFPLPATPMEAFEDGLARGHHQFLEYARGECAHPATSLEDTRGYLLATNGMLLSSQKIHSITPSHLRKYTVKAVHGYDVAGLYDAVDQSFCTGQLFSELGLPWAVKTDLVSVENLESLNLTPKTIEQGSAV